MDNKKELKVDTPPIIEEAKKEKKQLTKEDKQRLRYAKSFIEVCLEYRYATKGKGYPLYETGSVCGNMVGDRIRHIISLDPDLDIATVARRADIGRNSLMRYLRKEDPDVPKPQTLVNIIRYGLSCPVEDFCFSPENYDVWETTFDGKYDDSIKDGADRNDYEIVKAITYANLMLPMVYKIDGVEYPVPRSILEVLSKQIHTAFETAELLLDYERRSAKPKGKVGSPPYKEEQIQSLDEIM